MDVDRLADMTEVYEVVSHEVVQNNLTTTVNVTIRPLQMDEVHEVHNGIKGNRNRVKRSQFGKPGESASFEAGVSCAIVGDDNEVEDCTFG